MKIILLTLSAYLFLCLGFETKPTPEGIMLVFIATFVLGTFAVAKSNRGVTIYFTKEQIEEMIDDEE